MQNGNGSKVTPLSRRPRRQQKRRSGPSAAAKALRTLRPIAAPLLALAAIILVLYVGITRPSLVSKVITPHVAESRVPSNPFFDRPATAPNGKPWPAETDYIAGFPRLNVAGRADVTISNIGGLNDLFVKLIDTDAQPVTAVRVIFLKAKNQFTLHRVKPGHYDVRYLNLDTGEMKQAPTFEVTIRKSAQGEEYQGWTVPIYEDINGTIFHKEIGKEEF